VYDEETQQVGRVHLVGHHGDDVGGGVRLGIAGEGGLDAREEAGDFFGDLGGLAGSK
jgi:hypothetical protein